MSIFNLPRKKKLCNLSNEHGLKNELKMRTLLSNVYENVRDCVRNKGEYPFNIDLGVRQGSILNPYILSWRLMKITRLHLLCWYFYQILFLVYKGKQTNTLLPWWVKVNCWSKYNKKYLFNKCRSFIQKWNYREVILQTTSWYTYFVYISQLNCLCVPMHCKPRLKQKRH